jgi:hypothetical protein
MRKLQQYQLDEEKHPAYNIHSGEDLQDELASRHLAKRRWLTSLAQNLPCLTKSSKGNEA